MRLLHIDSGLLGDKSISRDLTAAIVACETPLHPGLEVIYRDLVATPIQHLIPAHVATRFGNPRPKDPAVLADIAAGERYIDDLFAADIIVIGVPMCKLSLLTQLKPGSTGTASSAKPSPSPTRASGRPPATRQEDLRGDHEWRGL